MITQKEKRWQAAVAAMQGLVGHPIGDTAEERRVNLVKSAFAIANAMLVEEAKQNKV